MKLFHRISGGGKVKRLHTLDPEDTFLDSSNVSSLNGEHMEGHIEKPLPLYVTALFFVFLCLMYTAFFYRLYAMQIKEGEYYNDIAKKNHVKSEILFAHRGTIEDRNGVLLAWNESAHSENGEGVSKRLYIDDSGFSHMLGYISYPKKDDKGVFWQNEYIGKDGLEKQYNEILQGVAGERLLQVSAQSKIEAANVITLPIDGKNIKVTIDSKVQEQLYKAMATLSAGSDSHFESGAGVIMNVLNGEILAMASFPEYDNNAITNATSTEDKKKVADELASSKNMFLNRVVSGLFVPGSTVKPFIGYAALTEKVIDENKYILSTGSITIKNKYGGKDTVFKDWKAHGYVSMREAISESSDEYFYQVGGGYKDQKGLGIARIDTYASLFGFGSTTGIDLGGERSGIIPSPLWKEKIFKEDWLLGNTYHTSIGQYGFQLSPLEIVRGIAALANGGVLVTPHLYTEAKEQKQENIHLDQNSLKVIQQGMRKAVTDGTLTNLQIEGVPVAGKSGTAELGISKELVNSLTVGYFPYESPHYAFVLIMEKGSRHNTRGSAFAIQEVLQWMKDNTDYMK